MLLRKSMLAIAIMALLAACSQAEDALHPQAGNGNEELRFTLTRTTDEDDGATVDNAYKGLNLLFYAEEEGTEGQSNYAPQIYDVYEIRGVGEDDKVTGSWLGKSDGTSNEDSESGNTSGYSHKWGDPSEGKREIYAFGYKEMTDIPATLPQTVEDVTQCTAPWMVAYEENYENKENSTITLKHLFGKAKVYIFGLDKNHKPTDVQLYVKTKGNIKYKEDEPIEILDEPKGCPMGDMTFSEDDKVNGEYWRSEGILVLPQELKTGVLAISFSCNGNKYEFTPKEDLEALKAGRINNIVLLVQKKGENEEVPVLDLIRIDNSISVENWSDENNSLGSGEAWEE